MNIQLNSIDIVIIFVYILVIIALGVYHLNENRGFSAARFDVCAAFQDTPVSGVRRFFTQYAKVGGTHHNMVCFGDTKERL